MAKVRLAVGTGAYHGGWGVAGGGDVCRSKDGLTLEDGDSVSVRLEEVEPAPDPSDLVITPGDRQLTVALPDDLPYTLKQVRASAFGSHKDVPITGDSIMLTGLHNCKPYNVHVRFTLANGNVVVLPDVSGTLGMPNGTELVPRGSKSWNATTPRWGLTGRPASRADAISRMISTTRSGRTPGTLSRR